jgi:hypothetical protein
LRGVPGPGRWTDARVEIVPMARGKRVVHHAPEASTA